MFDANASHINIGRLFFVEIQSGNDYLTSLGINRGDVIMCQHTEKGNTFTERNISSNIWYLKDGVITKHVYIQSDDRGGWLVYSGCPDGHGFLEYEHRVNHYKEKALSFLNGVWLDDAGEIEFISKYS